MGSTYKPTDSAWDYISQTATCHQVSPVGSLQTRGKKKKISIREGINITGRTGMLQGIWKIIPGSSALTITCPLLMSPNEQ